jgi:general secretion pathway protein K
LLSVLWILLLLSGLAATAMYVARMNAILTHRELELARGEAAADAAIVDTISRLSDDEVARHPAVDGTMRSWEFDGVAIQITVSNEAGRIDVNAADLRLLSAFLASQGLAPDRVLQLIADVRPAHQSGQLERPLETPEELRALGNWKSENLDCWLNSLTVYTGLPGVAPAYASPATLAALQKASGAGANDDASAQVQASTPVTAAQSVLGDVLRIRATAATSTEVATTSEWIGRLTGDRRKPMLTMRWDHAVPDEVSGCGQTP